MATYLIKRLLQGIIVLLAVSFVCFIMFRYTGDPVLMLAGKYATQQEREMVRVSYGLGPPHLRAVRQFHRWRPQG
jgi:ABC-type dipeptide/oligopeptide/nickel transport system permease component